MPIEINLHLEKVPFEARGDCILVRVVKREKTLAGIHMPDQAAGAQRFFAVSVGPDVKGVEAGDELVLGTFTGGDGAVLCQVHGHVDLFVTRDCNAFLKIKKSEA